MSQTQSRVVAWQSVPSLFVGGVDGGILSIASRVEESVDLTSVDLIMSRLLVEATVSVEEDQVSDKLNKYFFDTIIKNNKELLTKEDKALLQYALGGQARSLAGMSPATNIFDREVARAILLHKKAGELEGVFFREQIERALVFVSASYITKFGEEVGSNTHLGIMGLFKNYLEKNKSSIIEVNGRGYYVAMQSWVEGKNINNIKEYVVDTVFTLATAIIAENASLGYKVGESGLPALLEEFRAIMPVFQAILVDFVFYWDRQA